MVAARKWFAALTNGGCAKVVRFAHEWWLRENGSLRLRMVAARKWFALLTNGGFTLFTSKTIIRFSHCSCLWHHFSSLFGDHRSFRRNLEYLVFSFDNFTNHLGFVAVFSEDSDGFFCISSRHCNHHTNTHVEDVEHLSVRDIAPLLQALEHW